MRVAITGASGLIGGALVSALRRAGHVAIRVGRHAGSDVRWDPRAGAIDAARLQGVDAVVHLAASPIGVRWSAKARLEIHASRVQGTQLMAETVAQLSPKPRVFVSASAIGYYGDCGDAWVDETSPPGADFLARVARDWEGATEPASAAGIRTVCPRIGIVLSRRGGVLGRMLPVFRLGGGGRFGSGRQWMSWVSLADLVRALEFVMEDSSVRGAVNVVAPAPVTNREFTTLLGRTLGRPVLLPVPALALRLAFGEMADGVLLAGQRVRATRLASAGFHFTHSSLAEAMRHEIEEAA